MKNQNQKLQISIITQIESSKNKDPFSEESFEIQYENSLF